MSVCVKRWRCCGQIRWTAGFFWSWRIHTIRGTSHADACEDGDNQPPPDAHQLLLHQESANNRGDVVE